MRASKLGRALIAMLALGSVLGGQSATAAEKPNFIVIMTDDMGYADLSCYGNDRYQTPHIDAMAAEGLRFTDYHSNGAVCSPTRAALMTGRYQQRSGVEEVIFADPDRGKRDDHGLKPQELTFAEALKAVGYRTAIFGKWHLGYDVKYNPTRQGFDEFIGYVSGNVDFQSHVDQAGFADWWQGVDLKDEPGYTTHLINRHAVRFIEQNKAGPFCLYLAHEAPHAPYQGPNDPPLRKVGDATARQTLSPAEIGLAYQQMVQEVDKGVGEIVATLRRLGIDRDTFIFFCSDNGGTPQGNNGPLAGAKGSLWEGGHRVPGIAWWPGRIKPGVTDQTAMAMDLMPTMLELSGEVAPHDADRRFDGISLAPLLLAGKALDERLVAWGYGGRYAIRRGPWKLLVNQPRPEAKGKKAATDQAMLFRLDQDVAEQNNLAEQEPERVKELQAALQAWRNDVKPTTE